MSRWFRGRGRFSVLSDARRNEPCLSINETLAMGLSGGRGDLCVRRIVPIYWIEACLK